MNRRNFLTLLSLSVLAMSSAARANLDSVPMPIRKKLEPRVDAMIDAYNHKDPKRFYQGWENSMTKALKTDDDYRGVFKAQPTLCEGAQKLGAKKYANGIEGNGVVILRYYVTTDKGPQLLDVAFRLEEGEYRVTHFESGKR